jgi:hypothetical protein
MERYLVRPFSTKVFIHTWDIDHGGDRPGLVYKSQPIPSFMDGRTKSQFFEEEIRPQSYIIENYQDWANINSISIPKAMFYGIYKANSQKIQYEKEYGITFDLVIRARMDLFFENFMDKGEILEVLENKVVYGCSASDKIDTRFITDVFGFSNSKVMDTYSGVWKDILVRGLQRYPAELELQDHLATNGIQFKWSKTRYRILNEWGNKDIRIWGDF